MLDHFFSEGCAPGSPPDSPLCNLCVGTGTTPPSQTCAANSHELYFGYTGAFRYVALLFKPNFALGSNREWQLFHQTINTISHSTHYILVSFPTTVLCYRSTISHQNSVLLALCPAPYPMINLCNPDQTPPVESR